MLHAVGHKVDFLVNWNNHETVRLLTNALDNANRIAEDQGGKKGRLDVIFFGRETRLLEVMTINYEMKDAHTNFAHDNTCYGHNKDE